MAGRISSHEKQLDQYAQYYITELNTKLSDIEKGFEKNNTNQTQKLHLVTNTQEMLEFIDCQPKLKRIGFIVKRPKPNQDEYPTHFSPILYDSTLNLFIQLDSFGFLYTMPERINVRFIYSPFPRQASFTGCHEDSIYLAYFILTKFPAFFNFCQSHCEFDASLSRVTLTESEELEHLTFYGGKKTKNRLEYLKHKLRVDRQLQALEINKEKPHNTIYRLTEWPVELARFIERFDQMYPLRTPDKLGHSDHLHILTHLKKHGVKRCARVSEEEREQKLIIKPNSTIDKDADFAGTYIKGRSNLWQETHFIKGEAVQTMFRNILTHQPQNLFNAKKNGEEIAEEKELIIEKIAQFIGYSR